MSTVYLALDVHATHCVLGQMNDQGVMLSVVQFPTTEAELIRHVRAIQASRKLLTLEEGPMARWIAQTLHPHVDELLICNPHENHLISSGSRKNDRHDVQQLCRLLRLGDLGLSVLVAIMETIYVRTGDAEYRRMAKFWGKLFLINFAIGVVTGSTLEFQFGTNWSRYSAYVGDVFGALLAIEATVTFFLESTFIAVWAFGWKKLSPKAHATAIWLVAFASNLSAYWILTANSWMQHPVGYAIRNGRAEHLSPSFPDEIEPVVEEVNALIDHYRHLIDRARNEAGNLAHALKNPLSVLSHEIAALDADRRQVLQAQLQSINDQVERILKRIRAAGPSAG